MHLQEPTGTPNATSAPTDPLAVRAVLGAYASGFFVMDDEREGMRFESPPERGILPLDRARVDRWMRRPKLRFDDFEYRVDTAFEEVLTRCAAPRDNDLAPFMTARVLDMYRRLHVAGFAFTIEAWEDGQLVGGTLGVSLGRAYFGESTFHASSGAGNAVMIATMDHLLRTGRVLCDIQFLSSHMARWGAIEVPRAEYLALLHDALAPVAELRLLDG